MSEPAGTARRRRLNMFAIAHSGFNFMPVRWRTIDAVEAARLAEQAREVRRIAGSASLP